jgi:hypothetical protein
MLVPAGTVIMFFCGVGAGEGRDKDVPANPVTIADNTTVDKIV